jgi:hypothetical protein
VAVLTDSRPSIPETISPDAKIAMGRQTPGTNVYR